MRQSAVFLLGLFVLGLTACNGSGGKSNNANGNGPQSKEEALQKLSPQHRTNFEAWQGKIVKACDASQAFGLSPEHAIDQYGIDGAVLIKKNNGSVAFFDKNSFAVLTSYNSFSGIGTTKSEESYQANGQGYKISAETKREGSNCSVYLFGQKVYETVIAESFNVGMQYSQNKEANSSSQIPVIKSIGISGAAEVTQDGLFLLLSNSLRPVKEAQTMIGQKLGLNADQSNKLIKTNYYSSPNSAMRIDSDSSAIWSNYPTGNLIAQDSNLKTYFDGTARPLGLEVRLQIPQFDFKGTKNSTDKANIKLVLNSIVAKKDNTFSYALKNIAVHGLVAFDQAEAEQCLKDRFSAYFEPFVGSRRISPSTELMFNPCRIILPKIDDVAYENGFLKSLIPIVFSNVIPSSDYQYSGWDNVLSYFAKEAIAQNKDLKMEIDFEGKTKIVPIIENILYGINSEIKKAKNMQSLTDAALQMGLDWSFRGFYVSGSRIGQIIQSVDNSADLFRVSSERLLNELAGNPNANDSQLSFALGLDNNYKNEAQKALDLAQSLDYADFQHNVINRIIQLRVTIEELKKWSNQFTTIKNEINRYPLLFNVKKEVVALSVKWQKDPANSQEYLAGIYSALNNSIDPFTESTKQLLRDLDSSFGANEQAIEFARSLTAEYKQLAISIRNNSAAAGYESWGQSFFNSILQKRLGIEQLKQWQDLWSSTIRFIEREKAKAVGAISSMPEWNRKKVIEVAVKENWSAADFAAFEAVASVAKSKNTCDRYKDMSSLADCAGLNLFSKAPNKFFDPAYNGRYGLFASDFIIFINRLSGFEWTTLRWTLINEFFGPWGVIWSKCDNTIFKQKATTLKGQIDAISIESDQLKKWELERQIKETINNCP